MKAAAFNVNTTHAMDYLEIQQELNSVLNVSGLQGMVFQVINYDAVKTPNHLLLSIAHALRRHEEKRNIANHVGIETLLFLLQNHQIHKAIKKAGIHGKVTRFYVVMFHDNEEKLLQLKNALKDHEGLKTENIQYSPITDKEMKLLEDLALFNLEGN